MAAPSSNTLDSPTLDAFDTIDRFYIAGRWLPPSGSDRLEVVDPATEETLRTVVQGDEQDVDAAARAAAAAFPTWSQMPLDDRLDHLQRFYDAYQRRSDEVAELQRQETGIPISAVHSFMTGMSGQIIASAIENARRLAWEYDFYNGSRIVREAYGVVAAISPWNNPVLLALNKIAMALAAGCTVVHKPASKTPSPGFLLAQLADEAGFPPGVFNVIAGKGSVIGNALSGHEAVDVVDFTGSLGAGRHVAKAAADGVKKVILELGGKSPLVILPDADFEAGVRAGISNVCLLSGQTCGAFTRMLIPRDRLRDAEELAAEVVKEFSLGPTDREDTKVGPVVSAEQRTKIRNYIKQGLASGARLITGGPETPEGFEQGYYVQPTVFSDVDNTSAVAQEEIFGPVQCLIPYDDEDHAVFLANQTAYGLRAAVFGERDHAVAIAKRIRAGQVDINGDKFTLEAPWGGYKASGYGRCMGLEGLEEFLQTKSLQIADDLGGY